MERATLEKAIKKTSLSLCSLRIQQEDAVRQLCCYKVVAMLPSSLLYIVSLRVIYATACLGR